MVNEKRLNVQNMVFSVSLCMYPHASYIVIFMMLGRTLFSRFARLDIDTRALC